MYSPFRVVTAAAVGVRNARVTNADTGRDFGGSLVSTILDRICRQYSQLPVSNLLVAALAATSCIADVPTAHGADGPGIGQANFTSDEVFHPIAALNDNNGLPSDNGSAVMGVGHVAAHRGYVIAPIARNASAENTSDAQNGIAVLDLSNPRAPRVVALKQDSSVSQVREAHGFGIASNDIMVAQARKGILVFDVTDPLNIQTLAEPSFDPNLDNATIGSYDNSVWWTHLQYPYVYAGGLNRGLHIFDLSKPEQEMWVATLPKSQLGNFDVGSVWALGNLLFVASISINQPNGLAVLDISDPTDPILLDIHSSRSDYASTLYGDRYYQTNRASAGGVMSISDVSDPSALSSQSSVTIPNVMSLGNVLYVQFQDGFAHLPSFNYYAKTHISDFSLVGETPFIRSPAVAEPDKVYEFANPLGNFVLTGGGGNGAGVHIVPHQSEPDTTSPTIMRTSPAPEAIDQAQSSRIGIQFSDVIDLSSLAPSSFSLSAVGSGSEPVAGTFSHQFGVVNFSPDEPLQAATTYRVFLPAEGVRDIAGNPINNDFEFFFSTGPDLALPAPAAPSITLAPASQNATPGQTLVLNVRSAGSPLPNLQWLRNGVVLSGATQASLRIPVNLASAGNYSVVATNGSGSVESAPAQITVTPNQQPPSIDVHPQSVGALEGARVEFVSQASGYPEPTFQWLRNGIDLADATGSSLTLIATDANAAEYSVVTSNSLGSVESNTAELVVGNVAVPPTITSHPADHTIMQGTSLQLSVAANGIPTPTYQWRKDGIALVDATSATLDLDGTLNDEGSYTVVVSNSADTIVSDSAEVSVTAGIAPSITIDPEATRSPAGQPVTLSVRAEGSLPLSYQWQRFGTALPGATSADLSFTPHSYEAGDYQVIISNAHGSTTSKVATLTLLEPLRSPSVTVSPASKSVDQGSQVIFTATVSGNPIPTLQWQHNGDNLAGEVGTELSLVATATTAGEYAVVATNDQGSVASIAASLVVIADTQAASPTSITVLDSNSVEVTLSEPVEMASANVPENYSFNPTVNVLSAIQTSPTKVVLTTAPLQPDTDYQLNISGLIDLFGNTTSDATIEFRSEPSAPVARTLSLVVGNINLNAGDSAIRTALVNLGHTVVLHSHNNVSVADTLMSDAVLISSTVNSGFVGATFRNDPRPVMTWESYLFDDLALTGKLAGVDYGHVIGTSIDWQADDLPLGSGLEAGNQQVSDSAQSTAWGIPGGTGQTLGTVAGDATRSTVFAYTTQDALADGTLAPGRRLAWYLTDASASVWTSTGEGLFEQAIAWLFEPTVITPTAPNIDTGPVDISVAQGAIARFGAAVSGFPDPLLQWQFNGTNLDNETANTLSFVADPSREGSYRLVATNDSGTAISDPATLSVLPPLASPVISTNPTNISITEGEPVSFSITALGNPVPTIQWQRDNQNLPGETGLTLSFIANLGNAGEYRAIASNSEGNVISAAALLLVNQLPSAPLITSQPISQSVIEDTDVTLSVTASGVPAPNFQWQKDSVDLAGQTTSSLRLRVTQSSAGEYRVRVANNEGSVLSDPAILGVLSAPVTRNIAFVVGNTNLNGGDVRIRDALIALGHNVNLYDDDRISLVATAGNDAVLISSTVLSGRVGTTFRNDPRPVMLWEAYLFDDMAMSGLLPGIDYGHVTDTQLFWQNNEGPLGRGISTGVQAVTSSAQPLSWGIPGGTGRTLATVNGDITRSTVFIYDASDALADGNQAPGRRLGWHSTDLSAARWTSVGESLFQQAIAWLLASEGISAPSITTQPVDQSLVEGDVLMLGVIATGNPAPAYQWQRDGIDLVGATSSVLSLVASTADSGAYRVVVSNSVGSLVSDRALVSVAQAATPPRITIQPISQNVTENTPVSFSVEVTGNPIPTLQWQRNGVDLASANSARLSFVADLLDAGDYQLIATNSEGSASSRIASLAVGAAPTGPEIPQPLTLSLVVGNTNLNAGDQAVRSALLDMGYTVVVHDDNGITRAATSASDAVLISSTVFSGLVGATFAEDPRPLLVWESFLYDDLGMTDEVAGIDYGHVVGRSIDWMNADPPLIGSGGNLGQLQVTTRDQSIAWGVPGEDAIRFATTSTSTNRAALFGYKQNALLANGSLAPARRLALHQTDNSAAVWSASGSSVFGQAVDWLFATDGPVNQAPQILLHPLAQSVVDGEVASFSVSATGSPAPSYRWQLDEIDLPGETEASIDLVASFATAGSYRVIVTNAAGSLTSDAALLTVNSPVSAPSFEGQPSNQSVDEGASVTFSASAVGNPAPTLQWQFNGSDLIGETGASLSLIATAANAGSYRAIATNSVASVTSSDAILTVAALPLRIAGLQTAPALVSTTVQLESPAIVGGDGMVEYSWDFGDGTAQTPFSEDPQVTHAFAQPGHYTLILRARDGSSIVSATATQIVHRPISSAQPQNSSSIVLDSVNNRLWNVNPDNDTVTVIDTTLPAGTVLAEIGVARRPTSLARANNGNLWVVGNADATVSIIHPTTHALLGSVTLPANSRPYGIVMNPATQTAYVSLEALGQIVSIDTQLQQIISEPIEVPPNPRGMAISADGTSLYVTRFISDAVAGEVTQIDVATGEATAIDLAIDTTADSDSGGRGLPNYLSSVTISPDGAQAVVTAKKDNIGRGAFRDGNSLDHDNSVRAIVTTINTNAGQEVAALRHDFDNNALPVAAEFTSFGNLVFVALQASNKVKLLDAYNSFEIEVLSTGLSPDGLVLDDITGTLYVHNFMSRSVTAFDVRNLINLGGGGAVELAEHSVVANELLPQQVLRGKQIFYNAQDPRMSSESYLSCSVCHLDGGHDGQTWDFTDRGEGLRNTTTLRGRAGLGHGLLHWSANFDEVQDFEIDIRDSFGGDGFLSNNQFNTGSVRLPLGDPKAGLNPDLDALAAYVASLNQVPASPYREPDGELTPAAVAGKELFDQANCASCHEGSQFTDGKLHDVGTLTPASGQRSGEQLSGIETPTLKGLWNTAPYFHNGSAATLLDVISESGSLHGNTGDLSADDQAALVEYLRQID